MPLGGGVVLALHKLRLVRRHGRPRQKAGRHPQPDPFPVRPTNALEMSLDPRRSVGKTMNRLGCAGTCMGAGAWRTSAVTIRTPCGCVQTASETSLRITPSGESLECGRTSRLTSKALDVTEVMDVVSEIRLQKDQL